jgi:FecR protein
MKRIFQFFTRGASKTRFGICLAVFFLAAGQLSNGAPLRSARVSAVIHDVRLLPSNAAPRPAAVNENVGLGTAVRTGTESRAELTFTDLTVTRLGENTIFSFNEAARELNVTKGAILVEVPPKASAAKITTAGVTAGVMGATALFATGPPTKFMMLEGIGTFYPTGHPERAVAVHAGEMVMMTADGHITQPTKFNVQLVLQTSHLIVDFPALANLPLILQVINQQLAEQSAGTANPIPSKDSVVDVIDVVSQNVTANPAIVATPVAPGPPVITSSVPYVINNGTVIATHPTITTNGVTDVGVLYRGRALDGPVSAFAFGSTSAFDIASGFDIQIAGNNAAAGFKFSSLQLAGNPTINTTNGPINLALIAIHGITSGAPGGTITFAGLKGVLLAAQKGSINLGPEISFSGLHDLNIYARGSSSDLTLGSDISTTSKVRLFAERDMSVTSSITTDDLYAFVGRNVTISGPAVIHAPTITLSAGQNLTWNGQTSDETAFNSSGDVTISAGQAINIANGLNIIRHNGMVGSGLNVSLSAGTDLLAANNLAIQVDNSMGGSLDAGANITLNTGGNVTVNGGGGIAFTVQNTTGTINDGGNITLTVGGSISTSGAFSLLVENYDFSGNTPGHIGTGGNISVTTGGDLFAQSVIALINNRSGGQIDSPVSLTLSIGGVLTTSGNSTDPFGFPESLSVTISTRFDNTSGPALASTVGGNATLTINAGSASIAGNLSTIISNSGSTLNGNALLSFGVTHDVVIQGAAGIQILNDSDSATPLGGPIHGSATLQVASNNFTANALFTQIDNRDGGVIDSNATLAFNLKGSLAVPGTNPGNPALDPTSPGEADFLIQNQKRFRTSATSGGTIGGNALIQLTAASASTAGLLDAEIDNFNGGHIGGSAAVNLVLSSLTTMSDADLGINNFFTNGLAGGTIGTDASVNVTANNISVGGSLNAFIDNSNGGSIGGNAMINMNVSGSANVTGDATVEILGSNGVAKGAAINFNGGSYGVSGTFLSMIDGDGAITFNNASVHADTVKVGVFGTNGMLTIGGGAISANTLLKLYAPGSNGTIDFLANCTLSNQSASVLITANKVIISNGVVVTIGGGTSPASVFTNIANYTGSGGNGSTTGMFGGNGATTSPLSSAPPFGASPSSPTNVTQQPAQGGVQGERTIGNDGMLAFTRNNRPVHPPLTAGGVPVTNRIQAASAEGGNTAVINVANSGQLLDLLDNAAPTPGGKITIPASNRTTHSRNSSRINADRRLKADGRADNPRLLASARSFAP